MHFKKGGIFYKYFFSEELESLNFLNAIIYKNSKFMVKLNFEKILLKKVCAFFETKKIEFLSH